MLISGAELIWQGRLHVGDQPGTFGDATYVGLATELPVTITASPTSGPDTATFIFQSEHVKVIGGYPGHLVTVFYYEETAQQYHWKEVKLAEHLMKQDDLEFEIDFSKIKPTSPKKPIWLSFRVEVDTEVAPGLYNDFVLKRFSLRSKDHKFTAELGFHYVP
jgi:hypothetical protein